MCARVQKIVFPSSSLTRYGSEFIQEAYLYHVTRRDIKHNFSPYFYLLYLIQGTRLSLPVGLLAFLPQASLLLTAAIRLHRDILFCCFVQTFLFVSFNKVCTSQVCVVYNYIDKIETENLQVGKNFTCGPITEFHQVNFQTVLSP